VDGKAHILEVPRQSFLEVDLCQIRLQPPQDEPGYFQWQIAKGAVATLTVWSTGPAGIRAGMTTRL
jgi:hypothetical protein